MRHGARVLRPDRTQLSWDLVDLEAWLPVDHRARVVWAFVEGLDLGPLYELIRSREGEAGRPAADPAVLMALWLYATIEGVGSARALARLAERDLAFRWLAGGVPVNHHGLSDFRVAHADTLDRLLTESVTALIAEGLVSLEEVAVDGTKLRAHASGRSFRSEERLARVEAAVGGRLAALKEEIDRDPQVVSRRQRAARERAGRETLERAAKARAALARLRLEKAKRRRTHPRDEARKTGEPEVSLTDPEARRMRFVDGAVRAAYNGQVAAVPDSGIVVSVAITDRRNDHGLAIPMVEDIALRYGRAPDRLLVDTGYASRDDIVTLAGREAGAVTVYAPPRPERDDAKPRSRAKRAYRRAREPEPVKAWRERMARAEGQAIYKRRSLVERVHAQCKSRGLDRIGVRGLVKAKAVALWHASGPQPDHGPALARTSRLTPPIQTDHGRRHKAPPAAPPAAAPLVDPPSEPLQSPIPSQAPARG